MSEHNTLREALVSQPEDVKKVTEHLAKAGVINLDADLAGAIASAKEKGLDIEEHLLPAGNNVTIFSSRVPRL